MSPQRTRTRVVAHQWVRDPDGPLLTKPPPRGTRTPNGMIWAHSLHDFVWIERLPGAKVLTIWTRSQLKEFGENYDEINFMEPDVRPRLKKPWPVLKLSKEVAAKRFPLLCAVDEGCSHEDSGVVYIRDDGDDEEDDDDDDTASCSETAVVIGEQYLVDNDVNNPLLCPFGTPYRKLWIPEIRERLRKARESGSDTTEPVICLGTASEGCVAEFVDERGIIDALVEQEGKSEEGGRVFVLATPPVDSVPVARDGTCRMRDSSSKTSITVNEGSIDGVDNIVKSQPTEDKAVSGEVSAQLSKDVLSDDDAFTELSDMVAQCKDSSPASKPKKENKQSSRDLFSLDDLPKLEQFIPEDFFPDMLLVHDPSSVTAGRGKKAESKTPRNYKRIFPKLARDAQKEEPDAQTPRVAELHLRPSNRLGKGNHSAVYRAPLTLPKPLSARSPTGQVTVAAKTAFAPLDDRRLLQNEAKMYNMFPKHLMQEYCGYNLVMPMKHPVPVGPVVPKFYGYYIPVDHVGNSLDKLDEYEDEDDTYQADWPSPILLMEECGEPIEPSGFNLDERSECYSLMLRLHYAGFQQGSYYVRNVVCQPGPLSNPPERRSPETPSFRIIDFGRGTSQSRHFAGSEKWDKDRLEKKTRDWQYTMNDEDKRAFRELMVEDWDV